jgi:hypothetical protein
MRNLIVALVATFVFAASAQSATYYVDPAAGVDGRDGTSAALAWQTITYANHHTVGGDVVYLMQGSHFGFPTPDSGGVAHGASSQITYIGQYPGVSTLDTTAAARSARAKIKLTSTPITKSYTCIKGVSITGDLSIRNADRDSVQYCEVSGSLYGVYSTNYPRINHVNFAGSRINVAHDPTIGDVKGLEVSWCNFPNLGVGVTAQPHICLFGESDTYKSKAVVDSMIFRFNRRSITVLNIAADGFQPEFLYCTGRSVFYGNYTYINNQRPDATKHTYGRMVRDSCQNNVWRRDTLIAAGELVSLYMSGYGNDERKQKVGASVIDSCVWNLTGCSSSDITWQNGMYGWTITRSVLAANGPAISLPVWANSRNVVDHCTLIGTGERSRTNGDMGVICGWDQSHTSHWPDSALIVKNSILYARGPNIPSDSLPIYWSQNPSATGNVTMFFDRSSVDSAGTAWDATHVHKAVITNFNLYAYYGYYRGTGDRSLMVRDKDAFLTWGAPNQGSSSAAKKIKDITGHTSDSLSWYGGPAFRDSAFGTTLNAEPMYGSMAVAHDSAGSTIGAIGYTARTSFIVLTKNVKIRWPGRDTVAVQFTQLANATSTWNVRPANSSDLIVQQLKGLAAIGPPVDLDYGRDEQLSQGTNSVLFALRDPTVQPIAGTTTFYLVSDDPVSPSIPFTVTVEVGSAP